MYIENIVIGNPLIEPYKLLSNSKDEYDALVSEKTFYTIERFLPRILVECGIVKSVSEVKRNRPDLFVELNNIDCIDIKIGKRKLYIIIGE